MKKILSTIMTLVSIGLSVQGYAPKSDDLIVVSPAFDNEKDIPLKYTCEGENIQPPLAVQNIPAGTKSLAVIMYDEDAPDGYLTHWVAFNIDPKRVIEENSLPGITGVNDKGTKVYFGPCPPMGTHFYHFQVFALDTELNLGTSADEKTLRKAMRKHILSKGELVGRYKKTGMADN